MGKPSTIDRFFKRKSTNCSEVNVGDAPLPASNIETETLISENPHTNSQRTKIKESENTLLERDPGLHPQIGDYHISQRDEI